MAEEELQKQIIELKVENDKIAPLNTLPNQEIIPNLPTPKNNLSDFIVITAPAPTKNSKICTKCKTEQSLSNFGVQSLLKDHLKAWCKSCVSNYHKLRYIKKKNKIKKQVKKWQKNNPEKIKKYQADYVQKIWDQVREERVVAFQNQSQTSSLGEQVKNQ